jgi:hypothetical protein
MYYIGPQIREIINDYLFGHLLTKKVSWKRKTRKLQGTC